jgi:lysophospholipase L1-like esterase
MNYMNQFKKSITTMNRRNFFRKTALASMATLSLPEIINAAMPEQTASRGYKLSDNDVILFQGDSITNVGRNKADEGIPNKQSMLGGGYTLFTAASILANHAEKKLEIYNRGVSGNKVFQLAERWDKDCIDLKPNVISILVGVNDFWHTKSKGYEGTVETYETDYRNLLSHTQKELPGIKIVICEPYIIHGGRSLDDTWEPKFAGYRNVTKLLSKEFKCPFVPFQSVFNEALKKAPANYWGPDGIHPSLAGAQLMAQTWVKAVLQ